jgi:hypothetical protein
MANETGQAGLQQTNTFALRTREDVEKLILNNKRAFLEQIESNPQLRENFRTLLQTWDPSDLTELGLRLQDRTYYTLQKSPMLSIVDSTPKNFVEWAKNHMLQLRHNPYHQLDSFRDYNQMKLDEEEEKYKLAQRKKEKQRMQEYEQKEKEKLEQQVKMSIVILNKEQKERLIASFITLSEVNEKTKGTAEFEVLQNFWREKYTSTFDSLAAILRQTGRDDKEVLAATTILTPFVEMLKGVNKEDIENNVNWFRAIFKLPSNMSDAEVVAYVDQNKEDVRKIILANGVNYSAINEYNKNIAEQILNNQASTANQKEIARPLLAQSKEHLSRVEAIDEVEKSVRISKASEVQFDEYLTDTPAQEKHSLQKSIRRDIVPVKVSNKTFEQLENMGKQYNLFKKMAAQTGADIATVTAEVENVEKQQTQTEQSLAEQQQQQQQQQILP